jgi:diguanylate cyclase (GGDEF)-like protein/PAS domain S-box-containing protein
MSPSIDQFDLSLLLARRIIEGSVQGILITNSNKQILWVNPVFEEITQYSLPEIEGKKPNLLSSGRHGSDFYKEMWRSIAETGTWHGEIWNRRKNGEIYPEWLNISAVHDTEGHLTHYVGIFSDITMQKHNEDRVRFLTNHDTLTGLPNNGYFSQMVSNELARAKRDGELCALLYLDIDRFKRINDNLGHHAGDEMLQSIGQSLRRPLRDVDLIGRFGADEFVVLAQKIREPADAARVAEKLLAAVSEPRNVSGHEIVLTASIGICLFPHDCDNMESMVSHADAAMSLAKNEGRNCYRFYSHELGSRSFEHLMLEQHMRNSLAMCNFELHYQPKAKAGTGAVCGVEALMRWRHPEKGMIAPGEFIEVAENSGLILPLGEWAIRQACQDCADWSDSGWGHVGVAVNISAKQFADSQLPLRIQEILRDTGILPSSLELEVTESSIMTDVPKASLMLNTLKDIGVRISVDDFGTGYSSLAHLKRFPIDTIKVDRSFVKDITIDPSDAAITRAVIALGHNHGLQVVAEGVETREQLDFLVENHCDQIQGYFFSKPVPAYELMRFLHHNRQHSGDPDAD